MIKPGDTVRYTAHSNTHGGKTGTVEYVDHKAVIVRLPDGSTAGWLLDNITLDTPSPRG